MQTCDKCLKNERMLTINDRINNLRLISKPNRGIFIAETVESSTEYQNGLATKAKIISINGTNIESSSAQQIANKLNLIKLPFTMTVDYTAAHIHLSNIASTNEMNLQKTVINSDISAVDETTYNEESDENNAHISDRQFSVVYSERNFELHLELRNGFDPLDTQRIWGWYIVQKTAKIPIGSLLLSINGINMLNGLNQYNINNFLTECTLPMMLIFEAPISCKNVPSSTFLSHHYRQRKQKNKSIQLMQRWLNDGGFFVIFLTLVGFLTFGWHLWFLLLFLVIAVFHLLKKRNKTVKSSPFGIVRDHRQCNKKEKEIWRKEENAPLLIKQNETNIETFDDIKMEESDDEEPSFFDPSWKKNICHPSGSKEKWGSYCMFTVFS